MDLLLRLPEELHGRILSYTYCPQSETLCEDIRSFVDTKQGLLQKYHHYWIVRLGMSYPTVRPWTGLCENWVRKPWTLKSMYFYLNRETNYVQLGSFEKDLNSLIYLLYGIYNV